MTHHDSKYKWNELLSLKIISDVKPKDIAKKKKSWFHYFIVLLAQLSPRHGIRAKEDLVSAKAKHPAASPEDRNSLLLT